MIVKLAKKKYAIRENVIDQISIESMSYIKII